MRVERFRGAIAMAIKDSAAGTSARRGPRVALTILVGLAVLAAGRAEAEQESTVVVCGQHWVGAWSTSQDNADTALEGQTGRMMVSPHWGGERTRIRLSNELSATAVKLTSVHIGKRAEGAAVKDGTLTPITFAGADEVTIPAGEGLVSDPVDFSFDAFESLAVSYYVVPAFESKATGHFHAEQLSYLASGDVAADPSGDAFLNGQTSWWYLDGIDVLADESVTNLVLFGDSITEGFQSTSDAQARYPDVLARRLVEAGVPLAVLNEGLSGNRVLHDGIASPVGGGLNALDRFGRDALSAPAPTSVVVLIGINDIGHPAILLDPAQTVSAQQIIDGLADIAGRRRTQA